MEAKLFEVVAAVVILCVFVLHPSYSNLGNNDTVGFERERERERERDLSSFCAYQTFPLSPQLHDTEK